MFPGKKKWDLNRFSCYVSEILTSDVSTLTLTNIKMCKIKLCSSYKSTNLAVEAIKLCPAAPRSKFSIFPMKGKLVKRGPGGIFLN